jgi:hypothetical protein
MKCYNFSKKKKKTTFLLIVSSNIIKFLFNELKVTIIVVQIMLLLTEKKYK